MITVTSRVPTYDEPATPSVLVHSHWNDSNMIVLEIDGKKVTVTASELNAAVKNASNTSRY